jgi:hypothetical protein
MTNPPAIEEGLLPCPFCGCPNLEYDIISIECPNCFACGPPRRAIGDDGVLTSDGQWNKRKALSVTNPDVERLQGQAEHLWRCLNAARPYIRDRAGEGIIGAIDAALADRP